LISENRKGIIASEFDSSVDEFEKSFNLTEKGKKR